MNYVLLFYAGTDVIAGFATSYRVECASPPPGSSAAEMTPARITHSSRVCVVWRRQRRRRQWLTLDGGAKNKGKSPRGSACYGTLCVCVGVCFFAHNKSKSRVIVCPFFYPFARALTSPFVFSLNYPSPVRPRISLYLCRRRSRRYCHHHLRDSCRPTAVCTRLPSSCHTTLNPSFP